MHRPHPRAAALPTLLAACLAASCATAPSATTDDALAPDAELAELSVPALPDWTDKYAAGNAGDVRFFNISKLMARYDLSRLEAVELQNAYRDLSRSDPAGSPRAWLDAALAQVRAGRLESGLDAERLAAAPFIVVLDLDETLYDQYYAGADACHDLAAPGATAAQYVKLAPGWDALVRRTGELGGAVVLFSANLDDTVYRNLAVWTLDGAPLAEHPAVAGVLTNSHLVLQEKSEGPGADNPRRGNPVVIPSKDLRIVDESLRRVVIVDDNPTRTFQHDRVRAVLKLDAEHLCTAPSDDPLRQAFEASLPAVTAELEDAVAAMRASPGLDFATAYLPFTMMGQLVVEALVESGRMTREQAIAWVRVHADAVEDSF